MTVLKDRESIAERRQTVVALSRMGVSIADIAAALRVTERTVQRTKVHMGIAAPPPPPLTADELARAAQLLDDGASFAEVARSIGRSTHALRNHFPGRGWTHAQVVEFAVTVRRMKGALR